MWLDHDTRKLYLACSDAHSRLGWFPSVHHYNLSGRKGMDGIVSLDLDLPGLASSGDVEGQRIRVEGFERPEGEALLDLTGFSVTATIPGGQSEKGLRF